MGDQEKWPPFRHVTTVEPTSVSELGSIWLRVPLLGLVVFFSIYNHSLPRWLTKPLARVARPFKTYLTTQEAEELLKSVPKAEHNNSQPATPRRVDKRHRGRSFFQAFLALAEGLVWLSSAAYYLFYSSTSFSEGIKSERFWNTLIVAVTWFYCTVKAARWQKKSPSYQLFALYLLLFLLFAAILAGYVYDTYVYQFNFFRSPAFLLGEVFHLTITIILLVIVFNTPISSPIENGPINPQDIGKKISPEDYTTLWKWITFAWMTPVTRQTSLSKEEDVWELSPTMRTSAVYSKYKNLGKKFERSDGKITGGSFFWHWWACNSLDVNLDIVLSMVSLVLEFSGPLFLKLILDIISELYKTYDPVESRRLRAQAVIYAFIALVCTVTKAGSDLHHLFYSRRAANRTRNEVMVAIYEKALRRREVVSAPTTTKKSEESEQKSDDAATSSTTSGSGSPTANGNGKAANGKQGSAKDDAAKKKEEEAKKKKEDEDEKKKAATEAADLGKIVNLMSTDTRTVERMIYMAYFFYSAPIQLIIAITFLYKLLGIAAFAGIGVFVFIAPMNHVLSGRAVKVYADMQTARDKKMSVLNEMISEIKFIKFLANEDRWTKRALDTRANELRLIRRSGYIDILFSFVWNACPIGVSILSFWAYIAGGHRLTVSTAFTAVQLFSMLSNPLGAIPMVLVQYFRLKISVERVAKFLSEPEVDIEVSSLRQEAVTIPNSGSEFVEGKIGIENGFFLWSEPVEEPPKDQAPPKKPWYRRRFWAKGAAAEATPAPEVSAAISNPSAPPTNEIEDAETVETSTIASGMRTPATASAIAKERRFQLRDINVAFPNGGLSIVTGPTASGKTALLRALLGEMYTMAPLSAESPATKIHLPKHPTILNPETGLREYISYASQTPWLEHLTIKQNILFGSEYDEKRYRDVVECCALKPDLEMLEDGDETEIGERGVSLSGGQKARVALARAIYAPTKYVLLDDPLSAVDSHTARFLFDKLFRGPLLANRTVILVTHHLELVLPGATYVVRMLDGRIDTQGSVSELRSRGILQEITAKSKTEAHEDAKETTEETEATEGATKTKKAKKLIEDEERAEGSVKLSIYLAYLKAFGFLLWAFVILFEFLGSMMSIGERIWMQLWGEAYETKPAFMGSNFLLLVQKVNRPSSPVGTLLSGQPVSYALPSADEHPMYYVGVFALIGLLSIILEMVGSAVLVYGAYQASKSMFRQLLDSVTRATMRWHDTTPTGRILNRLSKDFETIDTQISTSFSWTVRCLTSLFLSVLTIVAISPLFLLPGALIAFAYIYLSIIYLRATRPLKRLDSTTLSPIFASFRNTLEGLAVVRAFSAERRFLDNMITKLDVSTKCYWTYWMVNRWLLCRFDSLGGLTVFSVMIIVVLFGGHVKTQEINVFGNKFTIFQGAAGTSSGFEGLVLVSAMGFTMSVYWACRFISELELNLNAVERVTEYLNIPQEPAAIIESSRPPAYWPSVTSTSSEDSFISVEDLVIKYAPDLPSVLHGVTFRIKSRERVGLVGRTGSGKSTLATALLRFVEPSEGRIMIDDIDISSIGLYDLRSRVTFIQQDSVLFSGTIRENLDPFNEYSDEACLDVLRRVHLIDNSPTSTRAASVTNEEPSTSTGQPPSPTATVDPEDDKTAAITLDSIVTSSGSNFSHGQRQLIALARALLRKTSVVIMDEATSSIDFETDNKIQEALREEFGTSCVITIAHRLQTIIDYDRVIVMDAGRIVENGPPSELISDVNGVFYGMCAKAGIVNEVEKA
ncbi:hypothetical protein CPB86DRAFT_768539 [Serendipita vermifera]|nr:hypothetical protein CPB86DRAFT_768539 [Serendipita vermifera]